MSRQRRTEDVVVDVRGQTEIVYLPEAVKAAGDALRTAIQESYDLFSEAIAQDNKDFLKALHLDAKSARPGFQPKEMRRLFEKHKSVFRSGPEICPERIQPVLLEADSNEHRDLFAIVRSLWSMPYNKGYGRRLRFVVFDQYHQGVIGIIGLQSPPADLQCRDSLFDYQAGEKLSRVNSTMDAYTVGAIPPYSFLLGGKLCAGMISTNTVRQTYWRNYAGKKTQMQNAKIDQPLVAVTTTSAFGRSSMYNRLRYKERLLAEPIGYTQGFGALHLEGLYADICEYLKMVNRFKNGGFGSGPKVRWQNITNALTELGITKDLLMHGIRREVFLFRLVDDLEAGMAGGSYGNALDLPEERFASYWKERWALPRAVRFPHWNNSDAQALIRSKLAEIQG